MQSRVEAACRKANAHSFIEGLTDGYDAALCMLIASNCVSLHAECMLSACTQHAECMLSAL